MAVKFPLEMKNGVKVRNISEFKENFDVEKVIGYFLDGKLKKWLDDRWYEEESEQISKLDADNSNLAQALSEVFGIEYGEEEVNPEEIAAKNRRIAKLKQYTDNEKIIENIESVAFDQEELAELYDQGVDRIYLCEGEFVIPKSKTDLSYELVGNVSVTGLERKQEKEEASEEVVCIGELSVVEGNYKYEDIKVYIDNIIYCKGTLEFENCEIYCDYSRGFGTKNDISSVLLIDGGNVIFKKCRLHISLEKEITFIGGRNCKVTIKECMIDNPKNLIDGLYQGSVMIDESELSNIFYPISKNYMKELTVSRCKISGSPKGHKLSKQDLESRTWFLFGSVDEGLINECTFTDVPQGIFSLVGKVTIDKSVFERCQAVLYRASNAVIRNSVFDSCIYSLIDACRQSSETLNLFNCKFVNCFEEIKAGNLKAEECCWDNGFVNINIPRYYKSSNGIQLFKCVFKNLRAENKLDFMNTNETERYISNEEMIEATNRENEFINAGICGEINGCTFNNVIMENKKYLISCEKSMKISNCNFRECFVKKGILDREEISCFVSGGGLFGILNKEYKIQPIYSISNCAGIY